MLWYKAWLETRWRFAFVLVTLVAFWLPGWMGVPAQQSSAGIGLAAALLNSFAALYLAGAGVNSQTIYGATSGFHGSMFFTLSLPASRLRLFSVRAGLGALETCIFVVMTTGLTLFFRSEATSLPDALRYDVRAIVCAMAIYAFSAFLACFLDEMWQFSSGCLILAVYWLLQIRFASISYFSPLRAVRLTACPLTAAMPWASLITSVALIVIFVSSSVYWLKRKEY